jgi:PKD repeat protein
MIMKRFSFVAALALTAAGLVGVGCNSHTIENRPTSDMKLSVSQSATKVKVNEAVTFEAHDANTLGRNAELKWDTTGGKMWTTDKTNRIVQVQYDKPGVYSVTATLSADGRTIESETHTVDVAPLP